MTNQLPVAVSKYKQAIIDNSTELFNECFNVDAVVTDNGKTYTGLEAIKAWGDELHGMSLSTKITSADADEDTARIATYVEGDFKNSPLPFIYAMTLKNNKIQSLAIKVNKQ
jgi:hypothetical protein